MTRQIEYTVRGTPITQGSKRAFVVNGRAVMKEDREKELRVWHRAVRDESRQHAVSWMKQSPLEVRLLFVCKRPTKTKGSGEWCAVTPDVDKLVRSVLDAMKSGGVLVDDAQVVRLIAEKRYGDELGVRITVRDAPHVYPAHDH